MLDAVFAPVSLSTGCGLFASFQASVADIEWHDAIALLAIIAGGMTLLGLIMNYFIVHNIKPASELQYDKSRAETGVERYRKPARILHWVCAAAFVILFITGVSSFASGGGELASVGWLYIPHIIAGVVIIAATVIYFLKNPKESLRGIKRAFVWGKEDVDWAKAAPQYYFICDERAMPPQGYFNTLQKVWLLLLLVFVPVLAVSGIVMWAFQDIASAGILDLALFVHDIAFITVGTMFLVHVYISILHPMSGSMEAGAWSAITRGKVSVEYARWHHEKWYRDLSENRKAGGNKDKNE